MLTYSRQEHYLWVREMAAERSTKRIIREKIEEWRFERNRHESLRKIFYPFRHKNLLDGYFFDRHTRLYQEAKQHIRRLERLLKITKKTAAQVSEIDVEKLKEIGVWTLLKDQQAIRKNDKYWYCCPLHNEKTPSFCVYPKSNTFYCFGCHVGGDVITLYMQLTGLDFKDAIKQLQATYF